MYMYLYIQVEPLNADTSQIWTLSYMYSPIMEILYKTTPESKALILKSGQLCGPNGVRSKVVPLYKIHIV